MVFSVLQSQHRLAFHLLSAREVEDDWIAQPRELRRLAGLLDGLVRVSELQISDLAVRRERFIEDDEGHARILAWTRRAPDDGSTHWSSRKLARTLGSTI